MLLASSSLQTIVIVGESYYNEVACTKVAAFEDKISVRDGISREDRHSFVTERSATPPYEMIILCARLRASKLVCPSVSALFLPNTCQSQPRLIQASILDQRTVRARFFPRFDTREREERDGSTWSKIGSFAPSTSHAYASIMNHSRGKVNFFLGRRKSVSKDDDDQFYRRQFSILTANSVFASRFPVPKYERVCFRIAIVAGLNGKGWKKGSTLVNLNLFVGRKVFGLEI